MTTIIRRTLYVIILAILSGCATKYIKFTPPPEETITTKLLSNFLENNRNPKVVLRTPSVPKRSTESGDRSEVYNDIYNAIEKELLNQGFIVRDRALFEEIASNEANSVDYEMLKLKSDTELIVELSKLDIEVLYETNEYYSGPSSNKKKTLNYLYKIYGASIEFKIVLIQNNEFAGSYQFNYAPCNETPCEINSQFEKEWKAIKKGKKGYTQVEKSELEYFMRSATRNLVRSMRNNR